MESVILDYCFQKNTSAQYVYVDSENNDQLLMVRILDISADDDGTKTYIVCANTQALINAGIIVNEILTNQYKSAGIILDNQSMAKVHPDELIPSFRTLYAI